VLLVGTSITAGQRFVKVWRQASVLRLAARRPAHSGRSASDPPIGSRHGGEDSGVAGTPAESRSRRFSTRDGEATFEERWQAWRAANRADRVRRPAWSDRERAGLSGRWRERRTQTERSERPRRRPRSRP
jgi:hypothetical protein